MSNKKELKAIRAVLASIDPAPAHDATEAPQLSQIYTPPEHEAALDPDRPLVVGGRGTGKSFWAAALFDPTSRSFVANVYPRLKLKQIDATLGFAGVDSGPGGPPSREIFDELIGKLGHRPETIWRAIVLRSIGQEANISLPNGWKALVQWCEDDAERLQIALRSADQKLVGEGRKKVIIFDALDRLGESWTQIRERTKALMRVALALRSYRAIKPKIFMRTDQAEDQSMVSFPDASKLLGSKVDLYWERADLYGLLFTLLANEETSAAAFEKLVKARTSVLLGNTIAEGLPLDLKEDEKKQEAVFIGMAGPYMGIDARRGKTYSWIHNHLADAYGRVSPRTFLMALRAAAQNSSAVEDRVVDPKALQLGLQVASEHRLQQLREEFGWINAALEPLADLGVPCEEKALFSRWKAAKTVENIRKSSKIEGYLEPVEFDTSSQDSLQSLLEALQRIGVAERRSDERINVPDIYRVAAKLLRKGGVPPKR